MKRTTGAVGALACVVLSLIGVAQAQTLVGSVRIQNPHAEEVQVYSQSYDPYGRPYWVHVATIGPGMFADIPGVPTGALLGLQNSGGTKVWPPIQVSYPNPNQPFVTYTVP